MDWENPKYKYPKYCLGIVFKINNLNYFAPISSIKENQLSDQDGLFLNDYFEKLSYPILDEQSHQGHNKIIASIKFNYMFPVHHADCSYVNTSKFLDYGFEVKYKNFVDKQYSFCLKYKENIKKMANDVYNKAINKEEDFHNYCLDFSSIEVAYNEWINNHQNTLSKVFPTPTPTRL